MPLAYSYLRLSTPEQIKGDSIRRQLERGRAYAAKHGLELDESLRDLGVSAYHGLNRERGALARFLDLVQKGNIPRGSYLIVENLDRLSREKPRQALQPFLALINAGIRIVTLSDERIYDDDGLDGDDLGLLVSLTVMMRANEESRLKSERVGAAWKQKHDRARDIKVTARCPGWLQLSPDRKKFDVIPDRAKAVRRAFELTANGIGRQKAAAMLNTKGFPSPGGTRWYAASIARLLKSDAVLGVYQPHEVRAGKRIARGEPIQNYYPAIVRPDVVARARAATSSDDVDTGPRSRAGRKGGAYTNLFGGLAYCNECNSPMRLRNRGRKRADHALVCSDRVETVGQSEERRCQHRRQYQYEPFERDFLRFIEEIDLSIFEDSQKHAIVELEKEIASLEHEHAARKAELNRLLDSFGEEGQEAIQAVKERIRERDQQVRELEDRTARCKKRLADERAVAMTARDQVLTIEKLQMRMRKAGGDERYAIRAQLAQEIRRIVETIWFGHPKFDCVVYVHTSRNADHHPVYLLRSIKEGRKVRWECYRIASQRMTNGQNGLRRRDNPTKTSRQKSLASSGASASRSSRASGRRAMS